MSDLPLNLVDPQLAAVMAGRCTMLHRPASVRFRELAPGHRLWIREPFHICTQLGHHAPSVALAMPGFRMAFAADFTAPDQPHRQGFGRRQPARCLPKLLHRQHLVVTSVARLPLADVPLAELEAQGFPSRDGFAATIEASLASFNYQYGSDPRPLADPMIQAIGFIHVPHPIPSEPE